ncbi:MAG TPA: hypothetical protein VEK79_15125 [Thermoanaerobaculia bacterium]|nr:hypothetical protein [Thermoanaerobaculia bacterium]
MRRLVLLLFLALPLAAQDLFPRFSITGGASAASFETNVRFDPDDTGTGTTVSFERDLGLEDSKTLQRFGVQWRPFARHELAATYFSAPRSGFEQIDREIVFRDEVYPVRALVTTELDLDYRSATYTYWMRRTERDGIGIGIGAAALSFNASIIAETEDQTVTLSERAETDVPVALAGLQGRIALTRRLHAEGSVSMLPRVTIEGYTGDALTANARLEYRPLSWLGIGAAYSYFRLNVDVAQETLNGSLDMQIRGPEGYLRLAF